MRWCLRDGKGVGERSQGGVEEGGGQDIYHTSQPRRFTVARDRVLLQGVVIELDDKTGKATAIQRVSEPLPTAGTQSE